MTRAFAVEADDKAKAWLQANPSSGPRAIDYDVHWCCGGGKLCQVTVRSRSRREPRADYVSSRLADGTEILIDPRAARRLPSLVRLTARGVGPFKHLDLVLSAEEWGQLLYT